MKHLGRIFLSIIVAVLAFTLNSFIDGGRGPLSGDAAVMQVQNSDVAAIASHAALSGIEYFSLLPVLVLVVGLALIWGSLMSAGRSKSKDKK